MTIFEKIIARQIPAKIIWEDDDAIAFHDVDPQAPVHVLIVPKKAVPRLADAPDADAGAAAIASVGARVSCSFSIPATAAMIAAPYSLAC